MDSPFVIMDTHIYFQMIENEKNLFNRHDHRSELQLCLHFSDYRINLDEINGVKISLYTSLYLFENLWFIRCDTEQFFWLQHSLYFTLCSCRDVGQYGFIR